MIQSKWVCVCFFPHYSLPLQWNPFKFHYGCSAHISNCKEKRLKIIRRFDQEYAQTTSQILLKNLQATSKALEINTSNKQNHQNADTNQTRMNIWLLRQWNGMRKKCKKKHSAGTTIVRDIATRAQHTHKQTRNQLKVIFKPGLGCNTRKHCKRTKIQFSPAGDGQRINSIELQVFNNLNLFENNLCASDRCNCI